MLGSTGSVRLLKAVFPGLKGAIQEVSGRFCWPLRVDWGFFPWGKLPLRLVGAFFSGLGLTFGSPPGQAPQAPLL